MKNLIAALSCFIFPNFIFAQEHSGEYINGLKLAYNNTSKKITGYFEGYSGWDEQSKTAQFSCIFYIEGTLNGKKASINTYYPEEKADDQIDGSLEIIGNNLVQIKLSDEHGGCWNVQHFMDETVRFELEKAQHWVEIRYVNSEKSYFHSEKSADAKLKSYLVKGNVICIEKIESGWALCSYFGKKTTRGWIKTADLNTL